MAKTHLITELGKTRDRRHAGGMAQMGSPNLGLIDEYHLLVHPAVLGTGKPLFKNIKDRVSLTLVKSKRLLMALFSFVTNQMEK